MNTKVRCLMAAVAGMTMSSVALAADTPAVPERPATTVTNSCDTSTGQTKVECEKVARQIAADPAGKNLRRGADDGVDKMTHSSPVMQTEEERAIEDARKKGKDPKKALEKVKEKDKPST